jgi:Zn finger protein HypA/HybF involved in hydrogenase expression
MANWVDAVMSPLKAAGDMAQGLIEIRDTVKFGDAVIKLQAQIMAAQQGAFAAQAAQASMADEIRDLKKHMTELEAWEAQKQRYELSEISTGVFAYVLKRAMRGSEPVHCICSECYQQAHMSILQIVRNTYGSVTLRCPRCKTEFYASEDDEGYPLKREHASTPEEKARATLETCPLCRSGKLAIISVRPHPIFGDVGGLQQRTLKCDNPKCGHTEERDHDPNKT